MHIVKISDLIDQFRSHIIVIDFQSYQPHPEGEFTEEQRTCRNWIFANYLLDGMPL